jgi:hypothetical protein
MVIYDFGWTPGYNDVRDMNGFMNTEFLPFFFALR